MEDTRVAAEHAEQEHFVGRYVSGCPYYDPAAPSLAGSLQVFSRIEAVRTRLRGIGAAARCLIQGYTAPGNAEALREFLRGAGIAECSIVAVDRLDMPAIYRRLGVGVPDIEFIQADAGDLVHYFEGGAFDILIQDFLLNCAPPAEHERLVMEAARLLRSSGLGLLSFTDSSGMTGCPALTHDQLAIDWGLAWNPASASLAEMVATGNAPVPAALIGRMVADPAGSHYTYITQPDGRLEFYRPAHKIFATLRAAGLSIHQSEHSMMRDYNGLYCKRYRCTVEPSSPTPRDACT